MIKFYPFEMLKLKLGIALGVAILIIIGLGLVSIPDMVWYPMIQIPTFTILFFALSNRYSNVVVLDTIAENGFLGAFIGAFIFVFLINVLKITVGSGYNNNQSNQTTDSFYGGSSAIGRTPFKYPDPFCPPKLDFKDPLDSDTERETPACVADPNELTEEQKLDEIDIYIRDAQESIARITSYLNRSNPDERWLSKKEMDDPNNRNLNK